eukprot:gene2908-1890_t
MHFLTFSEFLFIGFDCLFTVGDDIVSSCVGRVLMNVGCSLVLFVNYKFADWSHIWVVAARLTVFVDVVWYSYYVGRYVTVFV